MEAPPVFCPSCGAALQGGRFCPRCGAVTGLSAETHEYPAMPPAQKGPPPSGVSAGGLAAPRNLILGGGAALLVAIIVVAVLLLSSGGSSYAQRSQAALAPLLRANDRLTAALNALQAGGSPASVNSALQAALLAARGGQRSILQLTPGRGEQRYAGNLQAALASEIAFLNAASAAVNQPPGAPDPQLQALQDETRSKLLLISVHVPTAAASFPAGQALSAYLAKSGGGATQGALKQFSDRVAALLGQSVASFHEINEVLGQMQGVASRTGGAYTLSQAQSAITSVVSNRTALGASTRALAAPSPLAQAVRDALARAFHASLRNDRAIQSCLSQASAGRLAIVFQGCLSSTLADSEAATSAKRRFFDLYNQMRQSIGQPRVSQQF